MATQLKEQLESLLPIPEKHKLLNQFINRTTEADVDNTLSVFSGQTSQHQLVRLRLAKKFHNVNLIMDLLKHGERGIVPEVLKLHWIYKNESVLLDPVFLMNEFFPNVSYSCRTKIINKMGRNVDLVEEDMRVKMDIIYKSIEQKYGFFSALPLLSACSETKLKSMIDSNRIINYTQRQIIALLKTSPELGISILKNYYSNFTNNRNRNRNRRRGSSQKALLYLFDNHLKEFTNLLIDNWDGVSASGFFLGSRRSKTFIQFHQNQNQQKGKELLVHHGAKLYKILHLHQIYKQYKKEEFLLLFLPELPENIEDFSPNDSSMWRMLNKLPKTKQLETLTLSFFKKYERNLLEHSKYMSMKMVILLPINSEDRLRIINWKIKHDNDSYNWDFEGFHIQGSRDEHTKWVWTVLKPIEQSIPELTLLYTSEQLVQNRATLAQCLILTCYFNQSPSELLKVLSLLNKRSRNDQVEVRTSIFKTFSFIMYRMELGQEHFDIILEIMKVGELYDRKGCHDTEKEAILEKYVFFHLKHNLYFENLFGILFKMKLETYRSSPWTVNGVSNPKDRKKILLLCIKLLEEEFKPQLSSDKPPNNYRFPDHILCLMETITEFNQEFRCRKNTESESIIIPLSSVPWLKRQFVDILNQIIEAESQFQRYIYIYTLIAEQAFRILRRLKKQQQQESDSDSELENENVVLLKYLNASSTSSLSSDCFAHEYILRYFLNHDPRKLNEKWTFIITSRRTGNKDQLLPFIKKLKRMNYKLLSDKTIEICLSTIQSNLKSGNEEEIDTDFNSNSNAETLLQAKSKSIKCLSILCEPSIYLQSIIPSFYPNEARVDMNAENIKEDYELRKCAARSLVQIPIPHLTFPALEKFCVGDYLKLTVGTLNSRVFLAPERKALEFLRHQLEVNGRVSVQKHMIRLFFKISSLQDKSLMLQNTEKEQTLISGNKNNATIRHEIFLQSSNLFRTSPSQETWRMFKSRIEKLTPIDSQSIGYLRELKLQYLCPSDSESESEILSDYIQLLLATVRRLCPESFESMLRQIEPAVEKVDESILDDIILNESDKSETGFPYPHFYVVYLLSSSEQQVFAQRLNNVTFLMGTAISITNNYNNGKKARASTTTTTTTTEFDSFEKEWMEIEPDLTQHDPLEQIFTFLKQLFEKYLNQVDKVGLKVEIFTQVSKQLEVVNISKTYRLSIYIQLALCYLKYLKEMEQVDKLKSFGASIAEIVNELVKLYGGEIISIVKDIVSSFLHSCSRKQLAGEGTIVELVSGLLDKSESRSCQIVAISLVENFKPKTPRFKAKLKEFLERIRTANDVTAHIFLHETGLERKCFYMREKQEEWW